MFLLADDLRADAIGAHGNPYIDTPNIDRLANAGFSFRHAYVMGSQHAAVCAPSRAMLLSGRHLYRVYDNLDDEPTFPQLLRQDGYVTFGTGKWHQSKAAFLKSFSQGRNVFLGGMSDHNRVPTRKMAAGGTLSDPVEKGFSSTLFADAAVSFIRQYVASGETRPFLAYVSFTAPHDPRTPPADDLARYPGQAMPLPPNYMPVHPFDNGWMTGRDETLAPWPRTPGVIRAQLGEYFGLITHMDAEVGRILTALRRSGLEDRTVVIFSADNGLALGSHGLLGKQNLYEHSARVPLIVAGPEIPQGQSAALTYRHDLFQTILGLTGTRTPEDIDGRDLSEIWRGERMAVRESLFTVYEDIQRTVRDGHLKLIRYPRLHYNQLFDLDRDPYELKNLAEDPAYADQFSRLMDLLVLWQLRTGDPNPLIASPRASMKFDYSGIDRKPDRHQPEVIVQKYFAK